ncbi:MAG: hypothetical protein HOV68_06725, partial [Streptomycetaceae bacterium]|nr:hypothetical protein [Streptomycetaceae bacterium]
MSARRTVRPGLRRLGRLAGRPSSAFRGAAALAALTLLGLSVSACGGGDKGEGGRLTMLAVQDSAYLDVFRTSNVAVA